MRKGGCFGLGALLMQIEIATLESGLMASDMEREHIPMPMEINILVNLKMDCGMDMALTLENPLRSKEYIMKVTLMR